MEDVNILLEEAVKNGRISNIEVRNGRFDINSVKYYIFV